MGYKTKTIRALTSALALRGGFEIELLAANKTLTRDEGQFQQLDAGGSNRNVSLPRQDTDVDGHFFLIANSSNGAENLVVLNPAGAIIGTVNQSEAGLFYISAAGTWTLFGMFTYSLT